jgi:hypothetical protein
MEDGGDMVVSMAHDWYLPADFSIEAENRNLKIRMLTENLLFDVDSDNMERLSKELKFINNKYPNSIISGSLALNLYGLIYRDMKDIDLIIEERQNLHYIKDRYGDENIEMNTERLGCVYVSNKDSFLDLINIFKKKIIYNVDFFLDKEGKTKSFKFCYNGLDFKIQCPVQIIEQKIALNANYLSTIGVHRLSGTSKHTHDLFNIYKNIDFYTKSKLI